MTEKRIFKMTKKLMVGSVPVGGGTPVTIQSMCNTKTDQVDATVAQIHALEAAGCEIIRIAVPDEAAAMAVDRIKEQITIPLIADIHFNYKLAIMCAERGIDALRINPGNIGGEERVKAVAEACRRKRIPIRIGVNGGTPAMGMIKSAMGIGGLLCMGIGDTMRVTLTADPVEEVYAAQRILRAAGLRRDGVNLIACPTCGRTRIDLIPMAEEVERRLTGCKKNITVAVMGCAVNGPGEASAADVGIAGGDGEGLIFRKGEILYKVPQEQLVDALMKEIEKL